MAIIYSYPNTTVQATDMLLGSDPTTTGNPTINVRVSSLAEYITGTILIGGTAGYMPVFLTPTTLGNSYVYQVAAPTPLTTFEQNALFKQDTTVTGTFLTNGVNTNIHSANLDVNSIAGFDGVVTFNEDVTIGSVVNAKDLDIYHTTAFKADVEDTAGNIGTNTQILSSLGAGNGVSWVDQVASSLIYQGVWDANANNPALASGVGTAGHYYIVNVAGTTNLDGYNSWQVGDWVVFSTAGVWQEIDNSSILSGAGTTNTMTKWTGASSIGDSNVTDNGTTIDIGNSAAVTVNFTNTGSVDYQASVNNVRFNQPIDVLGILHDSLSNAGVAGQVLATTGAGVLWTTQGFVDGSGTLNTVPKWTPDTDTLGNSNITDDGTTITLTSTNVNIITTDTTLTPSNLLVVVGDSEFRGDVQLGDAVAVEALSILAATTLSTGTYIRFNGELRDSGGSPGTAGQLLESTGTSVDWVDPLTTTDGTREYSVKVVAAQLATIGTVPVTLISAPAAGQVVEILSATWKYDYGTTVYDFTSALGIVPSGYIGNTDFWQAGIKVALLNAPSDFFQGAQTSTNVNYGSTQLVPATAMVLRKAGADPTQGDGDLYFNIRYRILDSTHMNVITT